MGRVSLSGTGKLWMIAGLIALPLMHAPATGGDHAAGSGQVGTGRFELGAESRPDGSDPQGYLKAQWTDDLGRTVTVAGRVTCLSVLGQFAGVGIRIDRASDPDFVGHGALFTVVDHGPPVRGQSADEASPVAVIDQPPGERDCSITISPVSRIERGDVEVVDNN